MVSFKIKSSWSVRLIIKKHAVRELNEKTGHEELLFVKVARLLDRSDFGSCRPNSLKLLLLIKPFIYMPSVIPAFEPAVSGDKLEGCCDLSCLYLVPLQNVG